MSRKSAYYLGYTLAEMLVVLMVIVILGALGISSFGGLRDTVLVKQNIEDVKQDLQLIQQKAMLLERRETEGWIYGIGIDFREIESGKYTFIKWCSPFSSYGDIRTRSEIIGFNPEKTIGELDFVSGVDNKLNATLPLGENFDTTGFCDGERKQSYVTKMFGLENGKMNMGFDISLTSEVSFVIFEAVTGRAFLYDNNGIPVNYDTKGTFLSDENTLGIIIFRNRGEMADLIEISSLSGGVSHTVVETKDL